MKDQKKPLDSDYMRKAYYELSDRVSILKEAAEKLGDDDILAEVKKLEEARDTIYKTLDSKYLWD